MKNFLLLFYSFLFISTQLFAYELINVAATGGESEDGVIPFKIEKFNPLTGEKTLLLNFDSPHNTSAGASFVDAYEGKVYIVGSNGYSIYDIESNTIEHKTNLPNGQVIRPVPWGGVNVIEEKSDGSIHVGQNSAVFKEENGIEKFWAQDANGNSIPIDITNGSKLLINGRDVEQSINNVGALSAALTGLPTVPQDSPLACGVGAGAHSGSNALSGGCASKIKTHIGSLDGVSKCDVNFDKGLLTVEYDESKMDDQAIVKTLNDKTTYSCSVKEDKPKGDINNEIEIST